MSKTTVIELFKDDMKFCAGHFTVFSATEREHLHGHNFGVYAALTAQLNDNGMAFDYDIYKEKIRLLCKSIGHVFLLAGKSPYLRIEDAGEYYNVFFNHEKIPFLKSDAKILPLRNITVEELAIWFVEQLTTDPKELEQYEISAITIKIYSAPGQCGSATWEKTK